uniref:Uncharacterized protein n=1 Tax=Sphaerodactylus townsendi TaxID=933632 RepID=A0ACB8E8Y8_9SAUR
MQPPVVALTDCSLFLCSFKQSKSAVRLKEDVKKIAAAAPLSGSRAPCWRRVFGVALVELQQQGLSLDGVPTLVRDIAEFLTRHGCYRGALPPSARGQKVLTDRKPNRDRRRVLGEGTLPLLRLFFVTRCTDKDRDGIIH